MKRASDVLLRGLLVGQSRPSDIILREGRVQAVRRAGQSACDFGGNDAIIAPPLLDIQVNGAAGYDLQGKRLTVEIVRAVTAYLAKHGVARWIPTLITGPLDEMEHGCRVLSEAMAQPDLRRAVAGIHLEGPFISPEDGPRGAHPLAHVRPPRMADFNTLYKAAQGALSYITLAPESPGALRCIQGISARGIVVSLGHHQASEKQIGRAIDAGARLCTHLGNGSSPQMHRQRNPLWPQLADDRVHASFIADLHHITAPALRVFTRAKRPSNTILVSDCVSLTGCKPGRHKFAGAKVDLKANGKICLSGTDLLAGSGVHLIQGIVNAVRIGALTLEEAFASATRIPARLLGLPAPPPFARIGSKANFLVFDIEKTTPDLWQPALHAVFIDGIRH